MPGSITSRGKGSWRIKYEAPTDRDGTRHTHYVTVRGTKRAAQIELTRRLGEIDRGSHVDPSAVTVAEAVRSWLAAASHLAPKTLERYRELADNQIIPHLGSVVMQRLRPPMIADWHTTLSQCGGRGGGPLAPRTVGHAHRLLCTVSGHAVKLEILPRNVVSLVAPPRVGGAEVVILTPEQLADLLAGLVDHVLCPIVTTAIGTGMRRGELCGLRWTDVDLDAAVITVEHSMEETRAGTRLKAPKTRAGRRRISIPTSVVETLRAHRVRQIELRLALGVGRLAATDYVFGLHDGSPMPPDRLGDAWRRFADRVGLTGITFHALRHTHASALISAGMDVVSVSRRLGHTSVAVTLRVYAHRFDNTDAAAAQAIDAVLRGHRDADRVADRRPPPGANGP